MHDHGMRRAVDNVIMFYVTATCKTYIAIYNIVENELYTIVAIYTWYNVAIINIHDLLITL